MALGQVRTSCTASSIPGCVVFDKAFEEIDKQLVPAPKSDKHFFHPKTDVDEVPRLTRRQQVKTKRLKELGTWLRAHNFQEDVNEPQVSSGCFWFRQESLYPIHVAAKRGQEAVVRGLLMAHADPKQKTSRGRTALAIAQKADVDGSHRQMVELLEAAEGVMSLRTAVEMMENSMHRSLS